MIFKGNTKLTPALTEILDDTTPSNNKTYSSEKIEDLISGSGSTIEKVAETTDANILMTNLNKIFRIGNTYNNSYFSVTLPQNAFSQLKTNDELLNYKYFIYVLENIGNCKSFEANTQLTTEATFGGIYCFQQSVIRWAEPDPQVTTQVLKTPIKTNITHQYSDSTGSRKVYIGGTAGQLYKCYGTAIADKITANDLTINRYFEIHFELITIRQIGTDSGRSFNGNTNLASENSKITIYGIK